MSESDVNNYLPAALKAAAGGNMLQCNNWLTGGAVVLYLTAALYIEFRKMSLFKKSPGKEFWNSNSKAPIDK